jgi:hypothetical protein
MRPETRCRMFLILAPILLLALIPSASLAQYSANVEGTVTDSTGAVIPQVVVTLRSTGTGVALKATANSDGYYHFSAIAPGDYFVVASMSGFRTETVAVTVTQDQRRGVNITLVPAASTVNVTVKEVAPALNPEETRIETTLATDEISKLPIAGHDVQQLVALTPGVTGAENTNPSGGYGATLFAFNFNPPFQSNGEGTNGNLYLLDDLPVSDNISQGYALILPNADMIGTVALQTQTYSGENGSAGSLQVSFNTKSGTNQFRGDLDYTYAGANVGAADNVTEAIDTSGTTPVGVPTGTAPIFHQNQLLVSVGGPIWKDRTFFFFSLQRQDAGIGTPVSAAETYDPAFVTWAHSAFPNSGMATGVSLAPNTRDAKGPHFAQVFANQTSNPCGTAATENTPSGTVGYDLPCDMPVYDTGMLFNQAQPFNGTQWFARVDQTFRNGQDRLYAGFERIGQNLGYLADRPLLDASSPSTTKYASVNWVHVFSTKLINEIHGGNLRGIGGNKLDNPVAGSFPNTGPGGLDTAIGYAYITPLGTIVPVAPETNWEHSYNLRDTLTYNFGNHTFRGGYQWAREDYLTNDQWFARGGDPYFALGSTIDWISNSVDFSGGLWTISGLTGTYSPQIYGAAVFHNGVWIDDTWRVRENLTVTAGLRWDNFGNPERYSSSSPFAPLYPGAGSTFQQQALNTTTHVSPNAFTGDQTDNWQPRVGFAYTPFKTRMFAVHGGFGLYENALTPSQIANNLPTQPPVRISLSWYRPLDWGDFTTTSAPWGHTFGTGVTGGSFPVYGTSPNGEVYSCPQKTNTASCLYQVNLNGFAPNVSPEKFLLYSLGLEQQFRGNVVAGIGYSGSHGYNPIIGAVGAGPNGVQNADFNLVPGDTTYGNPLWGQLRYTVNGNTDSNFNALIVTLKQRYKGLSYQANYNWERALQWAPTYNDSDYGQVAFWPGVYAARTYYGPSSIDVADSFSFGGSYEVPKLATNNRLLNEAVAGWRISTITAAETGTPFSVGDATGASFANDNGISLDGSAGGTPEFPTYQAGMPRKGFSRKEVSTTGVVTAADFTNPPGVGTQAVLSQQGANTFRNPGFFNVNAGVAKSFDLPFRESANLTLRGDFINLLNRTNWGPVTNDMQTTGNTSYFGFSSSVMNKRYVQLGARFEF